MDGLGRPMSEIYRMNADGSGARPLTDHSGDDRLSTTFGGFTVVYAEIDPWSPDVYIVNADGSELRNLTDSPAEDTDAFWVSR